MQNAGQYVPGAPSAHPPQQFVPSEPSPNGGSTTSSLRQFRKRDVDKSQLEQPPKQESHVARVAPHNHYPPVSNDPYRFPHQFSDYSPPVKYSDIADASQPNPISTSVIQKPKSKEFMEMCNVQQQHINNQQQYSPDNGQYMSRDHSQGYPTGFKPETHYHPKDQHQYQQIAHHPSQQKFSAMMTQNMRKYNPGPADNPFLNKLSKIHPSMARSIMSDHHLQEPQHSYSPMDQRVMYNQQNHRYYASTMHQPNPYAPNPNYSINAPHHYPNYASTSCSYPRTTNVGPITPRYSHMERGISPTRRGYPENLQMNHLAYHSMPQKMSAVHNYSPQYGGSPEYAQHYQHRRMGQESYLQPSRPMQFMPNHHQMPAQEMQDLPESRTSPSDSIKKFIENWAADEEPSCEINAMEGNLNLRDTIKVRDDAPPGTVYMINATDVQYFENNGIPIVTSDNGGIQLTSENYQYLLKNGLVDNSGMVRIIEANKEVSIDSNGNQERVVNLQIIENTKSDCMMVSKNLRPNDSNMGPNSLMSKTDDETRRVVIHQNKVINPANCIVSDRLLPNQQAKDHNTVLESISISKELVDKNCSPINLDQLEHNLTFNDSESLETESDKNKNSFIPANDVNSNNNNGEIGSSVKSNEITSLEGPSSNSDDSHNKSPGSKSMPIIDLFLETQIGEREKNDMSIDDDRTKTNIIMANTSAEKDLEKQDEMMEIPGAEKEHCKENIKTETEQTETDKSVTEMGKEKHKNESKSDRSPQDLVLAEPKDEPGKVKLKTSPLVNSVIVSSDAIIKNGVVNDDNNSLENGEDNKSIDQCAVRDNTFLNKNTDEAVNTDLYEEKPVLNNVETHTKEERTLKISKTIDTQKSDPQNQTTTVIATTEISGNERRKRIFSVDDIIHHIGNNIKRESRDCDLMRSPESLSAFIEKEIEFSSLEQILITDKLNSKKDQDLQNNKELGLEHIKIHKTTNDETLENLENVPSAKTTDSQKNSDENKKMEVKTEIGVNDSKELPNNKLTDIETKFEDKNMVDDSYPQSKGEDKEIELTELSEGPSFNLTLANDKNSVSQGNDSEVDLLENNMKIDPETNALSLMESNELPNTPSDVQYRNIIRVEETSVLLQVAGELMEISVNIVNGKKVISVVPLSDTTVVDFNDNYEVSANMQDADDLQVNDNEIETEKSKVITEFQENSKENIDLESENKKCISLEKKHECSFPTVNEKEIHAVQEDSTELLKEIPQQCDQEDLIKERDGSFEDCIVESQDQHILGENKTTCSNTINLDGNTDQEKKSKSCPLQENKDAGNLKILSDIPITRDAESFSEDNTAKHSDTLKLCQTVETPKTIEAFEVVELTEIVDDFVATEVIESVQNFETELMADEPITSPKSIKLANGNDDKMDNLSGCNPNVAEVINKNEKIVFQEEEANISSANVIQNSCCPEKNDDVVEYLKCDKKNTEHNKSKQSTLEQDIRLRAANPPICNTKTDETDYSDIDAEPLDYQLEDDVFLSEEATHEIIVTHPLEGVGLIEEVNKTYDTSDIPLEPVTTTHEIEETSQLLFTEFEESDMNKQVISEPNEIIKKAHNVALNEVVPDLTESFNKFRSIISDIRQSPAFNTEKIDKELIVRITKPEVQILSPTSTNIDDHVPLSNKNVYLEPRRTFSTDDESISVTVTTKAAKKLYESDLQIPAVTTSGDVSIKSNKKSTKYQHDTVSSSEKERVLKEPTKTKKSSIKRSKRINEKIQIKNEQKEMLRLLADKRKQRMELKQRKAMKQEQKPTETENNSDLQVHVNKQSEVEKNNETNLKISIENDDEYVDFKELLRARKLKKLKKMQEMKRRSGKEIKVKTEIACSSKHIKSDSPQKENSVTISNGHKQDKKAEGKSDNLNDKFSVVKGDKHTTKKRKRSSNFKSSEKEKEIKEDKSIKTKSADNLTALSEIKDIKILATLPTEIKSKDLRAVSPKTEDVNNKLIITSNATNKLNINVSKVSTKTEDTNNEAKLATSSPNVIMTEKENNIIKTMKPQKRVSFSEDTPSSILTNASSSSAEVKSFVKLPFDLKKEPTMSTKDPRCRSKSYTGQVIVPSVSELIEENTGTVSKKKISLADYVSRKRKTSNESITKSKSEGKDVLEKRVKLEDNGPERRENKELLPNSNVLEESACSKKSANDLKTSFITHSSDWEDSNSPKPATTQSNDECLIHDFSGLIKNNSKRPVIDVNELTSLETTESPKDKKLQEYKDMIDSQLSSLNIQIPKLKCQSSENKSNKLILGSCGSPESSSLVSKFLNDEKMTESEMEKIRKIISYKRRIQHQKNARSPSKSPGSASSTYHQSPARLGPDLLTGSSPVSSASTYSESSFDPTYEIKSNLRLESDSREMRLHLKKVNSKRKLPLEYDDAGSSSVCSNYTESRHNKTVDYSVINRLGKDGLPKIIFKRNRQSNVSDDNQLVVELERIDNNLEKVEEKYNVTVTQMM